MLGRNRVTVQDWLALYRQGGVEKLLTKKDLTVMEKFVNGSPQT